MSLKEKIQNKDISFGVIGLGYVGLPLAVEFASSGFHVTGIDIDKKKVQSINEGDNYIQDVDDNSFKNAVESGLLKATADYSVIEQIDAISICVPTPLNKLKDPDVSYIISAIEEIAKYIHREFIIVLESTTYPGTTREVILTRLEESGLKVGQDFYLLFSPERVDPGNKEYNTKNTPKVMGGVTDQCSEYGKLLYEQVIENIVIVDSPEAAELVKLLENTFRSINIGLVNEMAIMAEKLGVNIWEVIEAADTKPFGFMKFLPGPGLGGHCIPIDPYYLSWKMKTLNYKARFIELAGEINTRMPDHVVQLIMEGLNRDQKSISGSDILVIGVAYKPNVNDVRESPAIDVIRLLKLKGANVNYYDPYVDSLKIDGDVLSSVQSNGMSFQQYDCCVIVTDHDLFDYDAIYEHSQLIVDTRNAIKSEDEEKPARVIKLGADNNFLNKSEQIIEKDIVSSTKSE